MDEMKELYDYFRKLRMDPNHHLGLGDIRLTVGQQNDIINMVQMELDKAYGLKQIKNDKRRDNTREY